MNSKDNHLLTIYAALGELSVRQKQNKQQADHIESEILKFEALLLNIIRLEDPPTIDEAPQGESPD